MSNAWAVSIGKVGFRRGSFWNRLDLHGSFRRPWYRKPFHGPKGDVNEVNWRGGSVLEYFRSQLVAQPTPEYCRLEMRGLVSEMLECRQKRNESSNEANYQ
jgi:hypothetical protein